ncbi:MAG: CBS domain-containing protein [Candidatus Hadarchaeota archaeon]
MGVLRPSEVKPARLRAGLTQSKLAEMAGVTQAYIAKIESGGADPRVSTLVRISDAIDRVFSKEAAPVSRIMSSPVISVRPSDKVARAVRLMESHKISQLPVLNGGVQVGTISESTIIQRVATGDDMRVLFKMSVEKLLGRPFPSVGPDENVDVIYRLLEQELAVLVVDRGSAVGIVTRADIFKLRGRERSA